ncbi:MFS transporter [Levilactobacillus fujinensis]|uniref:Major facilitator superfamily (MFS) profile domain-containing protein n=1 Tax=Levilactobacillus fujinensis TaxID=2486024 RepID=A0ABW1THH9_9LACO|nr:hypothetical protein [Levilactobacillus fujinensis]
MEVLTPTALSRSSKISWPPEDISEAEGFESGINSTIAVTGGLIGAALLTTFHDRYSLFARLNSVSFFLALVLLFHVRQPQLLFMNYGYTVALVGMIESVGSIIGFLLPRRITQYLSISKGIILIYIVYGLMPLNIPFLKSRPLLLGIVTVSGILLGILNPQVQGKMINELPKKSIGAIISAFYTVVQLTIPLGSLIFATLANALSLNIFWVGLLLFDGVTFIIWLVQRRYQRQDT